MTACVPVLLYHGIGRSGARGMERWEIEHRGFLRHMRHLADAGYRVVPLAEHARSLQHGAGLLPRSVVITFDDGYANFLDAAEIMADFGYPSTLFVPTEYVAATSSWLPGRGGRQSMLSWPALERLRDLGVEIGAHSHDHIPLDEQRADEIRHQVVHSKEMLEDKLSARVRAFAYPFGYSDRRVRMAVAAAGYEYACAVKDSLSAPFDDRYAISRLFAPTTGDIDAFERLLQHGNRRPRRHERVVTTAWRLGRRARAQLAARVTRDDERSATAS